MITQKIPLPKNNLKCEYCKKELTPLNPPIEDYIKHKFCINLFGWKLMLLREHIEMGCIDCLIDRQQSDRRDEFEKACSDYVSIEIAKGNLRSL